MGDVPNEDTHPEKHGINVLEPQKSFPCLLSQLNALPISPESSSSTSTEIRPPESENMVQLKSHCDDELNYISQNDDEASLAKRVKLQISTGPGCSAEKILTLSEQTSLSLIEKINGSPEKEILQNQNCGDHFKKLDGDTFQLKSDSSSSTNVIPLQSDPNDDAIVVGAEKGITLAAAVEREEITAFIVMGTPTTDMAQPASPALSSSPGTLNSQTDDTGRTLRRGTRKRTVSAEMASRCPICHCVLRMEELARHLNWEVDKLDRISRCGRKNVTKETENVRVPTASTGSSPVKEERIDKHQTYMRVHANRLSRLASRRKEKPVCRQTVCPVCCKQIEGKTEEELNQHVEMCLKNGGAVDSDDEMVDIEGDQYEEYTWAGQTRIRATTMLPGGLAGSGFPSTSRVDEDIEVDLNVDDDDSPQFGELQYSEGDLIVSDKEKDTKALRNAFLKSQGTTSQPVPAVGTRWEEGPDTSKGSSSKSDASQGGEVVDDKSNLEGTVVQLQAVVASLKEQLREQKQQLDSQNIPKCLICMESYVIPLTSVQCWHVHCEECWLRTLGTKKLCPQCNMITSPSDLRRIYL